VPGRPGEHAEQDAGPVPDLEDVQLVERAGELRDLALLGPVEQSHQPAAERAEAPRRQRGERVRRRSGAPGRWCRCSHAPTVAQRRR
jgi:hypothetical protein